MPTHYSSHRAYRRQRARVQTELKDSKALRLAKVLAAGIAGLAVLVILGAKLLMPADGNSHIMSADQEQACSNAYMSADAKLSSVLCDTSRWHSSAGSQASVP